MRREGEEGGRERRRSRTNKKRFDRAKSSWKYPNEN
jgi:hypothetical protein